MSVIGWQLRPLGQCAKFLSGGTPNKSRDEFWQGEIPWVSSGEMIQSHIYDTELHINEEGAREGSRLIPANTVLAVVRGMSLAKEFRVAITKREMAFNQDLKAFFCVPDVESEFLFYALVARREYIRELATEASHGTKKLETDVLSAFKIPIPKPDVQRRVIDVISTYDDLIENNRRRMALLEETAWLLYQEWFVRSRFPGHEHTRILNCVPEGWCRGRVADLGEIITGKTPSTEDESNYGEDIPFVKTPDMHRQLIIVDTEQSLSKKGANSLSNKFIPEGSILVACIGAKLGVVSLTSVRCQTNQQINAVIPSHKSLRYYSFFALRDLKPMLQAMGGGATMPNVNKTKFSGLPLLLPPLPLLSTFNDVVDTVFSQIRTLLLLNKNLASARDLLLPRLMSGEIAV
jgi:type I restriction enzyme S subunit